MKAWDASNTESAFGHLPERRLYPQELMKMSEAMLACKFRIHPDHEQEGKQLWTREVCRRVYNRFLELHYSNEHDRFKFTSTAPSVEGTVGTTGTHACEQATATGLRAGTACCLDEARSPARKSWAVHFIVGQSSFRSLCASPVHGDAEYERAPSIHHAVEPGVDVRSPHLHAA